MESMRVWYQVPGVRVKVQVLHHTETACATLEQ